MWPFWPILMPLLAQLPIRSPTAGRAVSLSIGKTGQSAPCPKLLILSLFPISTHWHAYRHLGSPTLTVTVLAGAFKTSLWGQPLGLRLPAPPSTISPGTRLQPSKVNPLALSSSIPSFSSWQLSPMSEMAPISPGIPGATNRATETESSVWCSGLLPHQLALAPKWLLSFTTKYKGEIERLENNSRLANNLEPY